MLRMRSPLVPWRDPPQSPTTSQMQKQEELAGLPGQERLVSWEASYAIFLCLLCHLRPKMPHANSAVPLRCGPFGPARPGTRGSADPDLCKRRGANPLFQVRRVPSADDVRADVAGEI